MSACRTSRSSSIANNPLIDDIWEKWQAVLEPLRAELNAATGEAWEEWQVPRALPAAAPPAAAEPHAQMVGSAHRPSARDRRLASPPAPTWNTSTTSPTPIPARVRVAGPFTVESLSPHRVVPASEDDLIEALDAADGKRSAADADLAGADFAAIVIDYLKTEGVSSSRPRATASPSRASRPGPATSSAPPPPSSKARTVPSAAPPS